MKSTFILFALLFLLSGTNARSCSWCSPQTCFNAGYEPCVGNSGGLGIVIGFFVLFGGICYIIYYCCCTEEPCIRRW